MSIPLLREEYECRNCHEPGAEEDLISPCLCSGSIKYVHRACLNQWRSYSPNPRSFYACDVCGYEYQLKERDEVRRGRIWRFIAYVLRDFFGAMIVMQAIIIGLAAITFAADSDDKLRNVFPKTWPETGTYYVWGLFWFSLAAALYGFILAFVYGCTTRKTNRGSALTYNTYPYGWGYYYLWFWNPSPGSYPLCPVCDCRGGGGGHAGCCGGCSCACGSCGGGSGSGRSSDSGGGMGIIAIIILAVAVVVGLIVMCVIAAIIISRHMKVLKKMQDAREMEVVDIVHAEAIHGTSSSDYQQQQQQQPYNQVPVHYGSSDKNMV